MIRRPAHLLLYGGTWVLLGLAWAGWDVAAFGIPGREAISRALFLGGAWAAAGLLVLRGAERFPLRPGKGWGPWAANLGLGILLALASLAAAWGCARLLGAPTGDFRAFLLRHLRPSLLAMAALGALGQGWLRLGTLQTREVEKAQLEARLATARNRMLLAQFQPHFLFNALNSIASLVHTDPDQADRMIAKLGFLLRLNLDAETPPEIPLEQERAIVEAYLAMERVRFQDRLEVEVLIPEALSQARVPKFLLQPLVENALRHGIAPRSRPGRIRVGASREGDRLVLEVQDNGAGFSGLREGIGLRNTRDRLRMLFHGDQALDIFSVPDKGTRVIVRIPLRLPDAHPHHDQDPDR